MEKIFKCLKYLCAVMGTVLGYLYGQLDGLLLTLLIFICLDIVAGVLQAIINKQLDSNVSFTGGLRKGLMLLIILLAHTLDVNVFHEELLRNACCLYYIANEALSITENLGKCGLPIPQKLRTALKQLKENNDDK